jgi:hypothetical protein
MSDIAFALIGILLYGWPVLLVMFMIWWAARCFAR